MLSKVMLDGVEKGMLSPPVHDAMTVKQCDTEWAKEGMESVVIRGRRNL
jgi:hypothetical protein